MKTPDHRFRKVLIVLGVNILISWVIGFLLKECLTKILSEPVYYQLIVLISLLVAPSVGYFYTKYVSSALQKRENSIRPHLDQSVIKELKGEERKYAESLMNPSMAISEQIRSIMAERDAFDKSK